eukprot:SAG31_NODE_250_length_19098_cov_4.337123_11_plen_82_part_00
MAASDGSDVVKITDFGMSKDESMSACKTYCGTLAYMAPEVTDIGSGIVPLHTHPLALNDLVAGLKTRRLRCSKWKRRAQSL